MALAGQTAPDLRAQAQACELAALGRKDAIDRRGHRYPPDQLQRDVSQIDLLHAAALSLRALAADLEARGVAPNEIGRRG